MGLIEQTLPTDQTVGKLATIIYKDGDEARIYEFIRGIGNEPLATGEPGESVQIGRLQVCDELEVLLEG